MPTTKKRTMVTLSDDLHESLEAIAKYKDVPVATVAAQLLEESIERYEDILWSEKVEQRVASDPGKMLSHEEFWAAVDAQEKK